MEKECLKSGYVAILGKPNVGKSTLLNKIIEEKIAIVSEKPQTTRNRIIGIKNFNNAQIIFIDTPGIHKPKSKMNIFMMEEAISGLKNTDVIVFLVNPETPDEKDEIVIEHMKISGKPVILSINKIDTVSESVLNGLIDEYKNFIDFKEIVPISALLSFNLDTLLKKLLDILPFGPRYYPDDIITDLTERFIVSEIIREKIFQFTKDEIPYSSAVVVDEFKDRGEKNLIYIRANIYVERESQKGIMIGHNGIILKEIGKKAREDMEVFLQKKVYLDLWVKVFKNWCKDDNSIKRLGYRH